MPASRNSPVHLRRRAARISAHRIAPGDRLLQDRSRLLSGHDGFDGELEEGCPWGEALEHDLGGSCFYQGDTPVAVDVVVEPLEVEPGRRLPVRGQFERTLVTLFGDATSRSPHYG